MKDSLQILEQQVAHTKERQLERLKANYAFARLLGLSPGVASKVSGWASERIMSLSKQQQ